MPKYKLADVAELAHQLTLSPRRQRLAQIQGAERLLDIVEPDRQYPYDFICYHLTGYRPLKPSTRSSLRTDALIGDLVRLVEHLSQSAAIPQSALSEQVMTQEELSARLNVSTKTISRWRQRGLSGWRVLDDARVSRLVFSERSLHRFVSRNKDLVRRGIAFKQLSTEEHQQIIARAAELVGENRLKLQEVARQIADEMSRAVETIRYTLRRHDRENPEQALFCDTGLPKVPHNYIEVFEAVQAGASYGAVAKQVGMSARQVGSICREMRAYELKNRDITCVYNPEFDLPDATALIIEAEEPTCDKATTMRPPSGAPAYMKALYEVPLLSHEQERDLFRRYNFCKHRAAQAIKDLEPCGVKQTALDDIDELLAKADGYQNRLIQANLRLVVNIANRHYRSSLNMFELISDGNMSLMRAIERFDYARGFKFSTYGTWAIMKNFARTIPEQRSRYARYVTGREEILESAPDSSSAELSLDGESVRAAIARGINQLDSRERDILVAHYGLEAGGEPSTLEQLGSRFGVTKERIRQIEKRALAKLKGLLSPALAEYAPGTPQN